MVSGRRATVTEIGTSGVIQVIVGESELRFTHFLTGVVVGE